VAIVEVPPPRVEDRFGLAQGQGRDGRPPLPSGASTSDATLRPTRSAACACRMARSMI